MVSPGSVVSHYRLIRRLGAGGMGEVYLAQDTSLDRPVAIKFLIAPDDEHGRQRLLREARAVAALDHPHICGVYEVGTDPAGGDFIVMQYIEGESLAARLKRGRLPPEEAMRIAGHVAEALQAAHRRGIIHRDLKPQNIIITPSGSPKLLDFGLARQLETSGVAAEAATVSPLTQPHAVIGTAGYMAPEQLRGRPVDARTDVFALGCVLYECLTGRRAFTGTTAADVNGQALHVDPPTVSSIVPDLGPAYDALCARLLQKSPEERLQSAEEVVGAIRGMTGVMGTPGAGTGTGWTSAEVPSLFGRRGLVALIVVALLGAGGIFATWQWHRGAALPVPTREAVGWYEQGVDALREGAYASARDKFTEALRVFPSYVQALSRMAEAEAELDDEQSAAKALLNVDELVPNLTRLPADDRLRLDAVRASVQRHHDQAIAAYRKLADLHPGDSGAWLDVGRAEEAAERRKEARADYAKALELDSQSGAAHVRLGTLLMQEGQKTPAVAAFDEAIRLYTAAANVEGEAEALLRKGIALNNAGDRVVARETLERLLAVANDRYLSQRLRAKFILGSLMAAEGKFEDAEAIVVDAVSQATDAGLQSLAAAGTIDHANILMSKGRSGSADEQFTRAIQLAVDHGARRTEMRARLQQAYLRFVIGKPEETVSLAALPLKFFSDGQYLRQEADGKNIVSRAQENLEHYDEASRLAREALQFAESVGDDSLASDSLENLAGQSEKLGRLPEALAYRERSEQIHRRQKNQRDVPYDLCNRAQLLIQLGRGPAAEELLSEVERGITTGADTYANRPRTVALLRALRASTELRFADVSAEAARAGAERAGKADSVALFAKVLAEYARSKLGRPGAAASEIAAWPRAAGSPSRRGELSYWVAQTLLERRENARAYAVAFDAWSTATARNNDELAWRMAATATLTSAGPSDPNGAKIPPHVADEGLNRLTLAWTPGASSYFQRPDLLILRERLQRPSK